MKRVNFAEYMRVHVELSLLPTETRLTFLAQTFHRKLARQMSEAQQGQHIATYLLLLRKASQWLHDCRKRGYFVVKYVMKRIENTEDRTAVNLALERIVACSFWRWERKQLRTKKNAHAEGGRDIVEKKVRYPVRLFRIVPLLAFDYIREDRYVNAWDIIQTCLIKSWELIAQGKTEKYILSQLPRMVKQCAIDAIRIKGYKREITLSAYLNSVSPRPEPSYNPYDEDYREYVETPRYEYTEQVTQYPLTREQRTAWLLWDTNLYSNEEQQ